MIAYPRNLYFLPIDGRQIVAKGKSWNFFVCDVRKLLPFLEVVTCIVRKYNSIYKIVRKMLIFKNRNKTKEINEAKTLKMLTHLLPSFTVALNPSPSPFTPSPLHFIEK